MNPKIGGKGFEMLANGLQINSRLKLLNFSETSPGKDGGKALREALWKQFKNTKKLIKETTQSLKECVAIKECVAESDLDSFPDDLIHEIVSTFIGYSVLKQLDLKNCYIDQDGPGIGDIVHLTAMLKQQKHELVVMW